MANLAILHIEYHWQTCDAWLFRHAKANYYTPHRPRSVTAQSIQAYGTLVFKSIDATCLDRNGQIFVCKALPARGALALASSMHPFCIRLSWPDMCVTVLLRKLLCLLLVHQALPKQVAIIRDCLNTHTTCLLHAGFPDPSCCESLAAGSRERPQPSSTSQF